METFTIEFSQEIPEKSAQFAQEELTKHANKQVDTSKSGLWCFTATQGDKVIGVIYGRLQYGTSYIKDFAVTEKLRGIGLGTQLIKKAIAYAEEQACSIIHVRTFSFQAPEYYKKFGFAVDFEETFYEQGIILYLMSKKLK